MNPSDQAQCEHIRLALLLDQLAGMCHQLREIAQSQLKGDQHNHVSDYLTSAENSVKAAVQEIRMNMRAL